MKPIHALVIAASSRRRGRPRRDGRDEDVDVGGLGQAKRPQRRSPRGPTSSIRSRRHCRRRLKNKPPALPKVPAVGAATPGAAPVLASAPGSATAPRVIYRRPAPIIIHKHSNHGDDGYESGQRRRRGGRRR